MVAPPNSAVREDSEAAGVHVCCSRPQLGDQDRGHTLCTYRGTRVMVVPTQGGQSHVSSLLCWLLKGIEYGSHEGFAARGARTPAGGQTARAWGCPWHGSCWLDKPSVWGLPKPRGVAELWCTSRSPRPVWGWQGSGLRLLLAPTDLSRHRFALPPAGWSRPGLVPANGAAFSGLAIEVRCL